MKQCVIFSFIGAVFVSPVGAVAAVPVYLISAGASDITSSPKADYLRGDVNGDGTVSVEDAQLALLAYTRRITDQDMGLTEQQVKAANVNGDAELSVDDAQLILNYYTQKHVAGLNVTWEDLGISAKTNPAVTSTTIASEPPAQQEYNINDICYNADAFRYFGDQLVVSARPFCHPEGNIFCHAGTGSVKGQALCFVRTPTFLIVAADAPGKTKAIVCVK